MSGAPASQEVEKVGSGQGKGKGNGKGTEKVKGKGGKGKAGKETFNADIGKIVNVMSADTQKVCE